MLFCSADNPTEMRIRLWGLSFRELLRDATGIREFEMFLKKEYSQENLRFWSVCEDLKFAPLSELNTRIEIIYRYYLF